jgi:hypothetical protein
MTQAKATDDRPLIHRPPRNQAELEEKRAAYRKQAKEIFDQVGVDLENMLWVTCPCGSRIGLSHAYRCFFCGVRFCETCAAIHFAGDVSDEARAEELAAGSTFGADGVRDPDYPCEHFRNGTPAGECESDGHYLCKECRELVPRDDEEQDK